MRRPGTRRTAAGTTPGGTTPGGEGRFPGYDVLGQSPAWDLVTAGVVLRRVGPTSPLRFFGPDDEATAGALFDQLLGQREEPKVPVLHMVDERLTEDQTDGWHYVDLPEDRAAWRLTLRHLDDDARAAYGKRFAELDWDEQADVVQCIRDLVGGSWRGLSAEHVWSLWTRYACTAFYGHPWAWNEIGFGGPAYPRGYKNVGLDRREPWEVTDTDRRDPVPWARRAEDARHRHADTTRRQPG